MLTAPVCAAKTSGMDTIALLLLAAGSSSRMGGRDKLLEPINGTPLLSIMLARAQATGIATFVTLPSITSPRTALLGAGITPVYVPNAASGMAASLRAGVAALPATCSAVMIIPADMPDLQTSDFKSLIEIFCSDPNVPILRATSAGRRPGHPVILPKRFFEEVRALTGDRGASPLLKAHADQVRLFALEGDRAITDLDTPEDWAAWRASQAPKQIT